ncbi:hypothetical protein BWP39_23720 [Paraburkholderia acidicola]|uniref:Uncharacterized protein n=1 Tax=Paraburkholderia acidicola TaxID=1912599 RepID=A0A2A4ENH2_9BURK|nr:hypothetical protein BWP39_23720 [Paraburkholderia acidicola]
MQELIPVIHKRIFWNQAPMAHSSINIDPHNMRSAYFRFFYVNYIDERSAAGKLLSGLRYIDKNAKVLLNCETRG